LKVISSTWFVSMFWEASTAVGSELTSLTKGSSKGVALRLTGAPHLPQNLAVIEMGFPQAMQSIALPS
jgi:hypothetical protein